MHISVLLNESIDGLNLKEDGIYLDCTLGYAGHSSEILKRIKKGYLFAIDQDKDAIKASKEKLSKIIFPLDGLTKDEVREIASEYGLVNANKKDSFDVCFIKGTFNDYISENTKQDSGEVIDIDTKRLENYRKLWSFSLLNLIEDDIKRNSQDRENDKYKDQKWEYYNECEGIT